MESKVIKFRCRLERQGREEGANGRVKRRNKKVEDGVRMYWYSEKGRK